MTRREKLSRLFEDKAQVDAVIADFSKEPELLRIFRGQLEHHRSHEEWLGAVRNAGLLFNLRLVELARYRKALERIRDIKHTIPLDAPGDATAKGCIRIAKEALGK